jgi:predicted O-methyltransferase YrrM
VLFFRICDHFGLSGAEPEVAETCLSAIPQVEIETLVPDGAAIQVMQGKAEDGNVTGFELIVIDQLVRALSPSKSFEIGTFDGRTTLNIAANSPAGSVTYTLDLPKERMADASLPLEDREMKYIDKFTSGQRFHGCEYSDRIVQIYGDSASCDLTSYMGEIDFVFVDGSHAYEYARKDSLTALSLLREGRGVILWHDYDSPDWEGVTRALNEFYMDDERFGNMRHIKGTSLTLLSVGVDPMAESAAKPHVSLGLLPRDGHILS